MTTERSIAAEHVENNQAVRNTLLSRGITPETLPPAEDVKKVERRVLAEQRKAASAPEKLSE